MLMVGTDEGLVEQDLLAGRLTCPSCSKVLGPWGHARLRMLRLAGGVVEEPFTPRRSRCSGCLVTHVLLSDRGLIRRRDEVEVIGAALVANAASQSHRRIASDLGVPVTTVRGWLRAFKRDAEVLRSHFTRWAHSLDPLLGPIEASGDAFRDALEAIGVAARAAVLRLGPRPPFAVASRLSNGALLANASWPFLRVP